MLSLSTSDIKKYKNIVIFLIYLVWIIRIKILIWEYEENNNVFDFIEDISKNKNSFNSKIIDCIKNHFKIEELNLNISELNSKLIELNDDIKNINIDNTFFKSKIIKNNIINIVKIIFLRSKLRKYIIENTDRNCDKFSWIEKINNIKLLNQENKHELKYCLFLLDSYIHMEKSPSLYLNGLELDENYINNLIDKIMGIIENEEN